MKSASTIKHSLFTVVGVLLLASCLQAAPMSSSHSTKGVMSIFGTITQWVESAMSRPVKLPPPSPMPPS